MAQQFAAISVAKSAPKNTDVLVLGLAEDGDNAAILGLDPALDKRISKAFGASLAEVALATGASTTPDTTALVPAGEGPLVLVVGMGTAPATPEAVRGAAGAALRRIAAMEVNEALHVVVDLATDDPEMVQGAAEGALLGSHVAMKVSCTERETAIADITIVAPASKDNKQACADAASIAVAVAQARDWVDTPPNLLFPQSFAESAAETAKGTKIDVEIYDDKRLTKEGFGGILAVGNGSSRKPRLVRYSYSPRGADFHLALIGKGITFDSGGLDIKPADGMYTMKCDMGGAATVLAAVQAISALGLKIQVTAWAAMAENMPSAEAYRPSDVLTMYDGTTVENVNTDAEGRLVMADALARANEDGPDAIIDVATLTGACIIALGTRIAGVMTTDEQLGEHVLDAAETAGEGFWQLPMPAYFRGELKSDIADIKSGGPREGGALGAATFLAHFVGDTPWAHLDIAGPAFNTSKPYGYVGKGASGHGVRTLVALAKALSE